MDLTGPNLRAKYRKAKPKGKNRANYNGDSGVGRGSKHVLLPMVPGVKRKRRRRGIGG